MSGALLIVRRADNGYDHAERNAQQQCQDRRLKRGEQTVEIQFPTAGGEKALVKADKGVVPEAQGLTGLCLCRQIRIELCPITHRGTSFFLRTQRAAVCRPLRALHFSAITSRECTCR